MKELSEWIDWARGSAGRLPSYGALLELLTELQAARQMIAELYPMEWSAYRGLLRVAKELRAAQEELAELREMAAGSYTVGWTWRDGELEPDGYVLTDRFSELDLDVDASGLVRAVLERQARVWVRAAEETPAVPLEQLLAMVPPRLELSLAGPLKGGGWWAAWRRWDGGLTDADGTGNGPTRAAAIRAATIALLRGRRRCETCWNWGREGETGDVRTCLIDPHLLSRSAASSCGGESWRPAQWLEPEPGDGEGGQ